ncbi:uncharacterized protein LOC113855611 [Abrus precatorius]|uniref:Uncharacterized protein LOC113855611 n=1 Tax=Abrus precatorius TaxID=3816 RepID=A0A8B8KGU7_ABRPR|nr:uncharacterized protein LOC113855611 [Abrus precatorius]
MFAQNQLQNQQFSEQLAALTQQISNMQTGVVQNSQLSCDFCGGNHVNGACDPTVIEKPDQLDEKLANRDEGRFPSSIIVNPKEQCQAITTRSGAVVSSPRKKDEATNSKEESELKQEDFESGKYTMLKRGEDEENCKNKQEKRGKKQRFKQACKPINEEQYKRLSFPKRVQDPRQEKQFERKLDMEKLVPLTEECSAILQRKLPQKLKDPGSFSIPCSIGNCTIGKALCDLGASINLMPLAIMKKLGIEEVNPTGITLQLADRSYTYPYRVVEDILVKVDKFIFPAYFVILDMEVDADIPLILGRPFLATGRALKDEQYKRRKSFLMYLKPSNIQVMI